MIVFTILLVLALLVIAANLIKNSFSYGTVSIILIIALGFVLLNILTGIYQAKKKFKSIAGYVILFTSIHYIVGMILLIKYNLSWQSILIGQTFATLLVLIMFCFNNKNTIFVFKPSLTLIRKYISFGLPLLVHGLTLIVIGNIDRIMVTNILSSQDNGIYTVAYMIGMLIGILHESLAKIWNPFFYERVSSTKGIAQISTFRFSYILFSIFALIVMYFIAPFIFLLLVDESYNEGRKIIPYILLAYTLESFRKLYVVDLFYHSKVEIIAFIGILGAVVNVILNLLWLEQYGITGAAYATLASFFITTVLTYFASLIIKNSYIKNES